MYPLRSSRWRSSSTVPLTDNRWKAGGSWLVDAENEKIATVFPRGYVVWTASHTAAPTESSTVTRRTGSPYWPDCPRTAPATALSEPLC